MEIPSWLFFGIYNSPPVGKWNPDKQKIAELVLKRLIEKAELHGWDIEQIIRYEKYDDAKGYYQE